MGTVGRVMRYYQPPTIFRKCSIILTRPVYMRGGIVRAPLKESPSGQLQGAFLSAWRKKIPAKTYFDKRDLQLCSICVRQPEFRIQYGCESPQKRNPPIYPPSNATLGYRADQARGLDICSYYNSRLSCRMRRRFKYQLSTHSSLIHLKRPRKHGDR